MVENLIADVLEEVQEDRAPIVPVGIDMNQRIYFNVDQPCFTEQAMRAAANKEVDAVGGRVVSVDLEKTVPGSKGRIAEVRKVVCLMAGDHATRPSQSDHLADDRFSVGNVYEHQARVNEIKDISR